MIASTWTKFPSEEDPFAEYKFLSFSLERDFDVEKTSRQTYSILDWLGDIGGLRDALKNLLEVLLIPLVNKAYKITVVSTLFRFRPQKPDSKPQSHRKQLSQVQKEFIDQREVKDKRLAAELTVDLLDNKRWSYKPRFGFLQQDVLAYLICCKSKVARKREKVIQKANKQLT